MKNILLSMILAICAIPAFGQTELNIPDTRSVNDLPSFAPKKFRVDFKYRAIVGAPGSDVFSTNMTISPWGDASGGLVHQLNFNAGGIYYRTGVFNGSSWNTWRKIVAEDEAGNVGIGIANPSGTLHLHSSSPVLKMTYSAGGFAAIRGNNDVWVFGIDGNSGVEDISIGTQSGGQRTLTLAAGGTARLKILANGNIGIGTITPAYKLTVAGTISVREVKVEANAGADFVFADDYRLRSLQEVEQFITTNKHLPDIAPADSMVQNGVNMGEMQIKLLQKIEELTLYTIEQQRQIDALIQKIEKIENGSEQ